MWRTVSSLRVACDDNVLPTMTFVDTYSEDDPILLE